MSRWRNGTGYDGLGFSDYVAALNCLCAAQDAQEWSAAQRVALLAQAEHLFQGLYQAGNRSGALYFNLARIWHDSGRRQAMERLPEELLNRFQNGDAIHFTEPFLPPLPRFDMVPIQSSAENWITARSLEAFVFMRSFSGYFSGQEDAALLKLLKDNPDRSAETQRRLALLGGEG